MSYISQRIVKGKKYYYLEESFEYKKKLVKESVYFGSMYPSNDEIFLGYEVLKRTCLARNHTVIVPPLTEFIRNRAARILEENKNRYLNYTKKLNKKEIQKITEEKINNLNQISLVLENPDINKKNLKNLFDYYAEGIAKNEPLTEIKIKKMYSLILGHNEIENWNYDSKVLHLFLTWYKEKNDLIYQIEFAAKFCAKFYNLKLFQENNLILSVILMNYILEQKGFPYCIIQKKRISTFNKAIENSGEENFKPITDFLIKEEIKTTRKISN